MQRFCDRYARTISILVSIVWRKKNGRNFVGKLNLSFLSMMIFQLLLILSLLVRFLHHRMCTEKDRQRLRTRVGVY